LFARGLQYAHGIVGTFVEYGVSQDKSHVISGLRHHLLHERIKGPARLT
jgi:hypothetical protein